MSCPSALAQVPPSFYNGTSRAQAYLQWASQQQTAELLADIEICLSQTQALALLLPTMG